MGNPATSNANRHKLKTLFCFREHEYKLEHVTLTAGPNATGLPTDLLKEKNFFVYCSSELPARPAPNPGGNQTLRTARNFTARPAWTNANMLYDERFARTDWL
jgi:hypothetical protein